MTRPSSVALALLVAVSWLGASAAEAKEMPVALRDFVMAAGKRPQASLRIASVEGEVSFSVISLVPDVPYLLWIPCVHADGGPLAKDPARALRFLTDGAKELAHRDFTPRFQTVWAHRDAEVWEYRLSRKGIEWQDARVLVLWRGTELLGIINDLAGRIESIEEPEASRVAGERAYFPVCRGGLCDLRVAGVRRERAAGVDTTTLVVDGSAATTIVAAPEQSRAATFTEYPAGNFPDQIDVDPRGTVWFTQPNNNAVTSFDPQLATFRSYPVSGGSGPDGMAIYNGSLWTGLYFAGGLGRKAIKQNGFTAYAAPYAGAAMAIPHGLVDGTLWVTDHANNRISRFDPATATWLEALVMPTANCWVVQGDEHAPSQTSYFAEYNVNQLGRKGPTGPIVDIPVPGGQPAFPVVVGNLVYYSQWSRNRLGVYNISNGQIVEYTFPVANEMGGPIAAAPNGDVVVGTRSVGYIMVFTPGTQSFGAYQIPTPGSGLKDGAIVDQAGTIWFTESGANKLGKLVITP